MAALPFVFLTNELHVIPPSTLQSGQHPSAIQITKHFYKPQVEEIKREFEEVKAMGSATAEEWIKGLDGRGKERRNDAGRWERWEASGGLSKMNDTRMNELPQHNKSIMPIANLPPNPMGSLINGNFSISNGNKTLPQQAHYLTNAVSHLPQPISNNFGKPINQSQIPDTGTGYHDTDLWKLPASKPPPRFDTPSQNGFAPYLARSQQAKHERTKEEVAELKAARRAEIERRCLLLTPPLTAGVLAHMASFQAAIQIIQPLTDGAWEVLKPRLLSQREEAEQRENDRLAQTRVVQERFDERKYQDLQAKTDPKDLVDREWDEIQAPLRTRIGGYADEIIRDGWNGGDKVSSENSPQFAAEVLIYVRKRFYAELAKDEAAVRATGREPEMDPPQGPYTRKLILENMKWVFDTKVKPHTEQYRKEIFLCNACDYASKYYGFEGVIQHYAAKHTTALSVGSIVVHWKSEWPEVPPFNPDPAAVTVKPYYPPTPGVTLPSYAGTGQAMPQGYSYGGYQPAPVTGPVQTTNPSATVYQESPAPYYGHPQYGDQYSSHQNTPYQPPAQAYPDTSQTYSVSQYSVAPPAATVPSYNDGSQDYSQQTFGGHYQAQAQPTGIYTSPHPGTLYTTTAPELAAQQPGYSQAGPSYGNNYNQPTSYSPSGFPQTPQRSSEYIAQLQDLARNARDIWNSIGGLKEVPGSLKVYTIIFHILERFRMAFHDDPPLSMVVDGLSNNKDMRPVRNVNGLLCKACSLGMAGSNSACQKKHFSFPQLVNHFHSVHEQGVFQSNSSYVPDWKTDMVDLPDLSKLRSIVSAPSMDEKKLKFFTDAVPELVAALETNTSDFQNGRDTFYGDTSDQNMYSDLAPSQDNHEKYYTMGDSAKPSESGYDSGEYDPRHPGNLPVARLSQYKSTQVLEHQEDPNGAQVIHQHPQANDQPRRESYDDRSNRPYFEDAAPRAVPVGSYSRVVIEDDRPVYIDRHSRYRDPDEIVEYRVRREPRILEYEERERIPLPAYQAANAQSYQRNAHDAAPALIEGRAVRDGQLRQVDDAAAQQNRIYEVVAQISQHAQQARERLPVKPEAGEAGSEDGEVRVESLPKPENDLLPPSDEAIRAAERFLNNFRPGDPIEDIARKPQEAGKRQDEGKQPWEIERAESRQVYRSSNEPYLRVHEDHGDDQRLVAGSIHRGEPAMEETMQGGYVFREHVQPSRPLRTYTYEDRYVGPVPEQSMQRDRSPELVDRRYKLNNVVYRDERQGSQSMHRTPSRYARYESVRLENDRARSRSPVYVKIGPQHGQYRERSPVAQTLRQEPIYRARTPIQHAEETSFERPRRQEYYRVYADEPRPREPQYAEAFELIRVSDPQGDYMIRRPVRREPEPVYATYEDDGYARQPVYESRGPILRAEPAFVEEEEYDPRHPAPPVPVRYQ
jgi:hypothetical protein